MKIALLVISLVFVTSHIINYDVYGRPRTGLPLVNTSMKLNQSNHVDGLNGVVKAANPDMHSGQITIPGAPPTPPDSPKDDRKNDKPLVPTTNTNEDSVLSAEFQRLLDKMKGHPANFSDTYLVHLDLTKFEIVIMDEGFDILNNTYIINNNESIADLFMGVLEHAHKVRPRKSSQSSQSATSSTTTSSSTSNPTWRITVERRPDGQAIPERPRKQKKSLANQNCGVGKKKFGTFEKKHIIDPKSTGSVHWSGLAYLTTLWNRIHEAYVNFSWFFIPDLNQLTYTYDEKSDKCLANQHFPMVTCQRHAQSDHIQVCYNSGMCKPSYYSSTGHFSRPECQPAPEEEPTEPQEQNSAVPDYFVTLANIRQLQDMFAAQILAAPPMDYDWAVSEWRGRWWAAIHDDTELDEIQYPEPTPRATKRERLLAEYIDAVRKMHLESIPESVLRLFYYQPRYYLERMPDGHRQGIVFVAHTMMTVNPDSRGPPSPDGIPSPPGPRPTNDMQNFPPLGERPRPLPESQTNPVRETHTLTSKKIVEIITSIFSKPKPKQKEPSANDVAALYNQN